MARPPRGFIGLRSRRYGCWARELPGSEAGCAEFRRAALDGPGIGLFFGAALGWRLACLSLIWVDIANPEEYDGKQIAVVGVLVDKPSERMLYASVDDAVHGV